MPTHPLLSKSRHLAGLQCPRRLWLSVHARDLATPPDAAQRVIFETGHRIGRLAHALFPGGVEIPEAVRWAPEAANETRRLLADPDVPAVFEGVFEHEGVRVHVDAIERLPDGAFGLREVKASTGVKIEHYPDVAVQRWVLEGAGVPVESVELIHVDGSYERGMGDVDLSRLFQRVELENAIAGALAAVPATVAEQHSIVSLTAAPEIAPGPRCRTPHRCEFWAHCTQAMPDDWIDLLPSLGAKAFYALRDTGVERMSEIKETTRLSPLQTRVRDVHRSGKRFVSTGLADAIAPIESPVLYLDLEALTAAVPLYAATHSFQPIPFQWSLHARDVSGVLTHSEFLADGRNDPRREFILSLIEAASCSEGRIVVWSDYEKNIMGRLKKFLPDLAEPISSLRDRLFDLHPVVKHHVYDVAFRGSFSIKTVAPALVRDFGWHDLATSTGIADGVAAAAAFERIVAGENVAASEEESLRAALRAYCHRDTDAMVRVHEALREMAKGRARD